MGGNFWKLGRMPRAEYLEVERAIREYLDARVPDEYRIPRYFENKPDFGDLDVLLSSAVLKRNPAFLTNLYADLGITQVGRASGSAHTTVFRGLQTDFFICPPGDLESSFTFMSWGEVGNILGRLARRFKVKFGIDGLSYVFRWGDHYKREFPLTKDFRAICDLFGLDFETWERGFATREDMFRWVTASPYFSPKPYLDPEGPMAERATIRPGIAAFIDWVKANVAPDAGGYIEDPIGWVEVKFPNARIREKVEREKVKTARMEAVAQKFNWRLVMALRPGLEGPALGEFIRTFKASKPDFDTYIIETPEEQIRADIEAFTVPDRGAATP